MLYLMIAQYLPSTSVPVRFAGLLSKEQFWQCDTYYSMNSMLCENR